MALGGLREILHGALFRARAEPGCPVLLPAVRVDRAEKAQTVDVTVLALQNPAPLRGRLIVVFRDVPSLPRRRRARPPAVSDVHGAIETELRDTREALRLAREEMQVAVEELRSSNEELQSTNEELQSANEELTTSREELQSLNEELLTVNAELQSKVEDLTSVRNDMTNLLNSTEIATVFLDRGLRLRRYTSHATRLFRLIPGDVGRPLLDIVTDLDYPQLGDDALAVLDTLLFREKVVTTRDGRWYRVRIMAYRTHDNVIDGVVITFIDVTEIKHLELRLRERPS